MGSLTSIRWNPHEAPKPNARPFGVLLEGGASEPQGMVALTGPELLFLRHFQAATLRLTGALFRRTAVESAIDPQRAWLDLLAPLLRPVDITEVVSTSTFDEHRGRLYHFVPVVPACPWAAVDADSLLEYQDFQAVVAHQTGGLYRRPDVEAIADAQARQAAWTAVLARLLAVASEPVPTL